MHVLVAWGSKRGGTEGIAHVVGDRLRAAGVEVTTLNASVVGDVTPFDAVIVGGAVYANRWHRDARRFVARHVGALRRVPVWLFSSGPLDDSADRRAIAPPRQVASLQQRIGALGHATFGGRLAADATGFPAAQMAKTHAGDFRNLDRIRAWAAEVAQALPSARPGVAVEPPARSAVRWVGHGLIGWALCAAVMGVLMQITTVTTAITLHAIAAPLIFLVLAALYFGPAGAREPLQTAILWTALVAGMDATVVAAIVLRSFVMFTSVAGTWLPFVLIFLVTWLTGLLASTRPWPRSDQAGEAAAPTG